MEFFTSPTGNDGNDGTPPDTAFATVKPGVSKLYLMDRLGIRAGTDLPTFHAALSGQCVGCP